MKSLKFRIWMFSLTPFMLLSPISNSAFGMIGPECDGVFDDTPHDPAPSTDPTLVVTDNYPAEHFASLIPTRNEQACRCKGSLLVRGMTSVNTFLRRTFGISWLSQSVYFRERLGWELERSRSNPQSILEIVVRERNAFFKVFAASVDVDSQYADLDLRISTLTKEQAEGKHSASHMLNIIQKAEKVRGELHQITNKILDFEIRRDAQLAYENTSYLELLKQRDELRPDLDGLVKEVQQLKSRTPTEKQTELQYFEHTLADLWLKRDALNLESQKIFAQYVIAITRLDALEQILVGDFNGLYAGQIDRRALKALNSIFETHAKYLSHADSLGGLVGQAGIVGLKDSTSTGEEKYAQVRKAAKRWLDIWEGRAEGLRERINFGFALTNISLAAWRVVANNGLRGQLKNYGTVIKNVAGALGDGVRRVPIVGSITNAVVPKRVSKATEEQVNTVVEAIEALTIHIRTKTASQLTDNQVRDFVSTISVYLMAKRNAGEPIDKPVWDLVRSAKGADIAKWMLEENTVDGFGYNGIVSEEVVAAQFDYIKRHGHIGRELAENLVTLGTVAGGSYAASDLVQFVISTFGW